MLLFCAQLSPELYLGIVCECACLKNRGTLKCRLTAELARSFHSCQLVRYGGPISKVVFPGFAVAATVHAKLLPECFRARQLPAGSCVPRECKINVLLSPFSQLCPSTQLELSLALCSIIWRSIQLI